MSTMLKRKIDEQNRLWTRMQEIQKAAEDESRDWTAEERTNWDKASADIDVVSGDIERLERANQLDTIDYRQVVAGGETPETPSAEAREAKFSEAFGRYLRGGIDYCTSDQRQLMHQAQAEVRAQGITTPSAGGYLVPDGFRTTMTETMKAFGGLLNEANVISTSTGNPLQWPTNNDTANTGAILAENTQITELALTYGTKTLGAYTYTSRLVLVSVQLLQDSVFDLDTWLPRKLGERIGRAVADDLVNGTGTGEPTGFLAGATTGKTSAGATAITYNEVIDLEHSVDPAYRAQGNCRFLMHDTTLSYLRKLRDDTGGAGLGRPLWNPVPTAGMPATINGHPYTIDQAMPAMNASTFVPVTATRHLAFGDFNAGVIVRQALDVQAIRLAERYADYLQVGFFGFLRLDATPDDTAAVKILLQA